eukprot:CAMPEP_0202456544 /NCGR_PEP_ID=MMETSP1360-20130828/13774_1 /ASSEMBLY_ACC=CAM_ASM_000848 /TAXON_ID=515479 /ORGANISM="Licmophora paradoxa, Strain CCMP2313" /LENGTH=175 /DNA_ID=CAMNT_0049076375 /DNA_START=122 /DNA_END=646 /DNA_ORIENTATION=-
MKSGIYATTNFNTWSGPIVYDDATGYHHSYVPVYSNGSLLKTTDLLHGMSHSATGPYLWKSMGFNDGLNPAMLTFPDRKTGKIQYSIWIANTVRISPNPDGPFRPIMNVSLPNVNNAAPVYHKGMFYMTSQRTSTIWVSPSIQGPWDVFSEINVDVPSGTVLEDPRMWIDTRGNW